MILRITFFVYFAFKTLIRWVIIAFHRVPDVNFQWFVLDFLMISPNMKISYKQTENLMSLIFFIDRSHQEKFQKKLIKSCRPCHVGYHICCQWKFQCVCPQALKLGWAIEIDSHAQLIYLVFDLFEFRGVKYQVHNFRC